MNRISFLCCSRFVTLFSFQSTCPNLSVVVGSNGLEPSTSRLSGARSNHLSYEPIEVFAEVILFFVQDGPHGGDEGDRTPDPLRARQVLSQLSYTPMFRFLGPSLLLARVCFLSVAPSKLNNVSDSPLTVRV